MKKLLIADDEAGIRSLVRMTLEHGTIEIIEASDGAEALAVARENRPDVLLLDVGMPGLTGFEVCRAIKEDPATAGIVVVMLTARAMDADRREGEAAGADAYLTKPFSPMRLLKMIDGISNHRAAS